MKVFHSLEEYRKSCGQNSAIMRSVTLGKFDGVHTGHRALVRSIVDRARRENLESVVFAIDSRDGMLLSSDERADYLDSLGVDILIECPFTEEFKSLSADTFVRSILVDALHASYIAIGYDYGFGHNREGNVQKLKQSGKKYGFETQIVDKSKYLGKDVSSTWIRQAVKEGRMELAQILLGRPYPIAGEVGHGRHLGSTVQMPTANVTPVSYKILPPDGVYASFTRLEDGRVLPGITNVGMRPTVNGTIRRSETMLFDFNEDIYGTSISTGLISFIRPEHKFSSLGELRNQVSEDSGTALEILKDQDAVKNNSFSM